MRKPTALRSFMTVIVAAAAAVTFSTGAASPSGVDSNGKPNATADVCQTPAAERQGGWFCIDPEASRQQMEQQQAQRFQKTSLKSVTPMASGDDGKAGWCNISGCWYLWNETPFRHSQFVGQGQYGYGTTILGSVKFNVTDRLVAGAGTSYTNANTTRTRQSKNNKWHVERYIVNGNCPYGCRLNPAVYKESSLVSASAGVPTSIKDYALTARFSTMANFTRIQWQDTSSNYPGTWWMYVKSAKITWEQGEQDRFNGSVDTPSAPWAPAGAGWWAP